MTQSFGRYLVRSGQQIAASSIAFLLVNPLIGIADTCSTPSEQSIRLLGSAEIPLEGYSPYYWRQSESGGRVRIDSTTLPEAARAVERSYQWYADSLPIAGATEPELNTFQVDGQEDQSRIDAVQDAELSASVTYTPAPECGAITLESEPFDYTHWRIYTSGEIGEGSGVDAIEGDNPAPFWETYSYNTSSNNKDADGNLYTDSDVHSITSVLAASEGIPQRDGNRVIKILADGSEFGSSTPQSYSKRSELGNRNWPTRIRENSEVYFSTSVYFPSEHWDTTSRYSIIVLQAKQYIGGEPNLVLRMSNAGDYRLYFQSKPHTDCVKSEECLIAQLSPDTWHDLKVRFKPADEGEGFMYVYVDGALAYSYSGTTLRETRDTYDPNVTDSFLKFGMYTEIRNKRVIYFDDIEMSNHIHLPISNWIAGCLQPANDTDCDGVFNADDAFPLDASESVDTDGDGIGNNADLDDDGDGLTDEEELADGTNPLSRFSCRSGCFSFDIDENSEAKALTDGLLVIRHLFGFTGDALATGAISTDATRDRAGDISALLADADRELDIDGNGESKALSDGLLLIRYLFGFTGDALIVGAIGEGATRDTSQAIEAYISDRVPASE